MGLSFRLGDKKTTIKSKKVEGEKSILEMEGGDDTSTITSKSLKISPISQVDTNSSELFEYDSIYEEISSTAKLNALHDGNMKNSNNLKSSKFIEAALSASNERKVQRDKATLERLQKEAFGEQGNQEGDEEEEVFVTSSYQKKLNELSHHGKLEQVNDTTVKEEQGDINEEGIYQLRKKIYREYSPRRR